MCIFISNNLSVISLIGFTICRISACFECMSDLQSVPNNYKTKTTIRGTNPLEYLMHMSV